MSYLESSESLESHKLKTRKYTFELKVDAAATPTYSSDLGGAASFSTTAAATGEFSMSLLASAIGELDKIYEARVISAGGTTTVSASNDSGDLKLDFNSDQNHTTTDETIVAEVTYKTL